MLALQEMKCKPCQDGQQPLRGEKLDELVRQVSGWGVLDGTRLTKTYRFPNFVEALDFVNHVGALAEEEGHHPDIFLAWGEVKIELWTHKVGGLSENDFILAAKIDDLYPL